jgi:hypothetical protein
MCAMRNRLMPGPWSRQSESGRNRDPDAWEGMSDSINEDPNVVQEILSRVITGSYMFYRAFQIKSFTPVFQQFIEPPSHYAFCS